MTPSIFQIPANQELLALRNPNHQHLHMPDEASIGNFCTLTYLDIRENQGVPWHFGGGCFPSRSQPPGTQSRSGAKCSAASTGTQQITWNSLPHTTSSQNFSSFGQRAGRLKRSLVMSCKVQERGRYLGLCLGLKRDRCLGCRARLRTKDWIPFSMTGCCVSKSSFYL